MRSRQKKKRFSLVRAVVSFIALAAVLFAAYVAIRCEGDLSWDNIERTLINIRADVKHADSFTYPSSENALMADLSGGILRLTGTDVTAYSAGGGEMYSEKLRFANPAISAANGRAAVYGAGDTEVRVFDGAGLIYELKTEEPVISATISSGGKLALCTREEGWSGSVTVYGIGGTAVYKWYCASGYPTVASVSRDGTKLAVLTLGSGGSQIVFLKLDSEEEQARLKLENKLALDIKYLSGDTLAILTENELIMSDSEGTARGTYNFDGLTLKTYSFGSDEIAVLALTDNIGRMSRVAVIDGSGQTAGVIDVENDVLAVSATDSRTAVLYADSAAIYRKNMESGVTLIMEKPAESILMRDDGTALIAGVYSAEVLEP